MIPPRGFKAEVYPLRHRIINSFGLSIDNAKTQNSAFITFLRHTSDTLNPNTIEVNPHNTNLDEETGPAVQNMSIIDRLTMSLKFNMTSQCADPHHVSGTSTNELFAGDGLQHIKLLWRPVFFSFQEKLLAADDATTTTVEAILGLTSDTTFEDVVPLTTTKLSSSGDSELPTAMSTVNIVEVFGDYNMTTDTVAENHPWDEDLFQNMMRRGTNKGALKACVGRTRHVHLSRARPFKNFYIDKFVPRAVRRIVPFSFMGIQIYAPSVDEIDQDYSNIPMTNSIAHVGVKCIVNYHEWNTSHFQEMTGTGPT